MQHRRVVLAVVVVVLSIAPAAFARTRAARPPGSALTYSITMPATERLSTGLGLGVLYDPAVLRFERFGDAAPDIFYFSPDPELVIDPDHAERTAALLRLTWLNASGRWAAALDGGTLATVRFVRLSEAATNVRVVSLSTDESHGIAAATTSIAPEATAGACRLDTRVVDKAAFRVAPAVLATFPAGQCTPDVDGNGKLDALTDGILLLRYLFGFTGNSLTAGAIGSGATRTTPAAVKAFLDQPDCFELLDLDENGKPDALTDGIVLIRQMFGFVGDDMVRGALAANAGRTSPDALNTTVQAYSIPRDVLVNNATVASGGAVNDASGDFAVTAAGGGVTFTLAQGTDYGGNRTVDVTKSGTGEVSIVLPPAPAGPPSAPVSTSSTLIHIGTLADVASQSWDTQAGFRQKWFYTCGAENRLPESVQGGGVPVVSSQPCLTSFSNRLHLSQYTAVRLLSACSPSTTSCYSGKEGVLFVHGFTPFTIFSHVGGGTSTWGTLPRLVQDAGYVPFEFRWITAARFDDVAADLKTAIQTLVSKTGTKVHIVAHSFGGLLVRQLLESSDGASVAPYIADVTTLGTPHSGISSANICPSPANVPVPRGSDNILLGNCAQISCYQAGFNSLFNINSRQGAAAALTGVYALDGDAGYLVGRLAQSINSFPAVDWLALMGLVTRGGTKFSTGDDLIAYEGERFLPSMSLAGSCPGGGVSTPLSTGSAEGAGHLWERVLGFTGQPVPGGGLTTPTDPAFNGGYAHASAVTLFGTRMEAEVDCAALGGCKHDTALYLLGTNSSYFLVNGKTWLAAHSGTVTPQTITFHVTIVDSVTRVPIPGAIVSIYYGASGPSAMTGLTGEASLTVPFEANFIYDLQARATGYVSLQASFSSGATRAATPTELGTRLLVSKTAVGNGTLAGTVQNVTTGFGIANASVSVRRSDRLTPIFTGTAGSNGTYSAGSLPAGTYVVSATASGFVAGSAEVTVAANASNVGNVPLSPQLSAGQARIVLTWGTEPHDLDSHLRKLTSGGLLEYHIYYGAKQGTNGDNLDVDDVTSFGPETVTIQNVDPTAQYRYWVHLFSGTGTIAGSPTRVTLTTSAGTLTFNAPASATGGDWIVFDIVNGQVVPCTGSCNVAPLAPSEPEVPKP
jgi:hypothetical protein